MNDSLPRDEEGVLYGGGFEKGAWDICWLREIKERLLQLLLLIVRYHIEDNQSNTSEWNIHVVIR